MASQAGYQCTSPTSPQAAVNINYSNRIMLYMPGIVEITVQFWLVTLTVLVRRRAATFVREGRPDLTAVMLGRHSRELREH